MFGKTWKNTVFSHFLRKVVQKAQKCFFPHLYELCTKCLEKLEKNTVFSHFLHDIVQKAQKMLFFRIFRGLCTNPLNKTCSWGYSRIFAMSCNDPEYPTSYKVYSWISINIRKINLLWRIFLNIWLWILDFPDILEHS